MSTTTTKKLITADEFAKMPDPIDGSKQELVRGEIITMPPPGFVHGLVQLNVAIALRTHARQTKSGRVTTASGAITEEGPDTVRGPDVAFWSFKRLPADRVPKVYANVAPDLCVEVLSPGNTNEKMTRKIKEYFTSGVQMVWVLDPDEQTVTVYRQPGDGRVLWNNTTISAEDLLPGFSCPVAEFFQLDQ
jgi:Uma2 family endonuclease